MPRPLEMITSNWLFAGKNIFQGGKTIGPLAKSQSVDEKTLLEIVNLHIMYIVCILYIVCVLYVYDLCLRDN